MFALIAALVLGASDAPPKAPPPTAAPAAAPTKPANIEHAVDANGVPAWATRKRHKTVQNCPAMRPNIGAQTWRDQDENIAVGLRKARPAKVTCK